MRNPHSISSMLALGAGAATLALAVPASAVAPPNDNFARAQVLQVVDPVAEPCTFEGDSDIFEATRQRGERQIMGQPTRKTVWFRWTPVTGCAAQVTIDTAGSDFDTLLAVYSTNRLSQLSQNVVAEHDDVDVAGGDFSSSVTFVPVPGVVYRIQVGGFADSEGNVLIQVTQ